MEKLTPEEWEVRTGISIMDPDGWRRSGDPTWTEPIDRDDFLKRAAMSTTRRWPMPLLDAGEVSGG